MRHITRVGRRGLRVRAAAATCIIAGTGVLAACGSAAAPGAASSPAPVKPKVSLTITVLGGSSKTPKHWTLQCEPAGGTHPDPAAACRALLAVKNPFAAPPPGHMCPDLLVSSARAIFNGTWFGTKVDKTITDGGCYLARWDKLGQVVN
jgi:Subtilisin inhibitor-like